jgi:SAM-dependent methyltransferase
MSIFPLDAVRNASIDQGLEPLLEDLRADVAAFEWGSGEDVTQEDALGVFDLARPRINVLLGLVRDLPDTFGADVSTGIGFLPVALFRSGINTVATERDMAICRFALAHGIRVLPYSIGRDHPPLETGSLDFLVFAEVLEHLKMPPLHALQPLVKLLRPGGRFIVTTPNVARLDHVEALVAGENFLEPFPEALPRGSDPTDYVEHVREYSVREIVDAMEGVGLTIDRVLMTGWGEAGYALHPNPYANDIIAVVATV